MAWDEGAANGGSVVVDYRVSYDQGTGTESYTILASELLQRSYVATGLIPGTTYTFVV